MKIIDKELLRQYRTPGRCEFCKRYCRVREPHHLEATGMGGGKRLDIPCNLIALGSSLGFQCTCHHDLHVGHISPEDMLAVVAVREGVMQDSILAVRWFLMRLPKDATDGEIEYASSELTDEAKALLWRSLDSRGQPW